MADLVIRADASASLGAGHVFRCVAVAQRWTAGSVHFVGYYPDVRVARSLAQIGTVHCIDRVHPHPDDLGTLKTLLEHLPGSPVVLDGYHFSSDYQSAVRATGHRLLVIDDTAHLRRYDADAILNANPTVRADQYEAVRPTAFLLGTKFALLRNEFLMRAVEPRPVALHAERLLVTFGAADPGNLTERVLSAWPSSPWRWREVRILVGPLNTRAERIREMLPACGTMAYGDVDMPELLRWADMAVSAAGGTCWELALAGVPGVLVATASNQIQLGQMFGNTGAFEYAGRSDDVDGPEILRKASLLAADQGRRAALRDRARAMVDGQGAARVVAYLEN